MSRTTGNQYRQRMNSSRTGFLPQGARRLFLAVAIPSLMAGCASHPTVPAPKTSHAKRVFRVVPSKLARYETYASNLPEISDSLSSAAIIERILLRQQAASAKSARGVKPRHHTAKNSHRPGHRKQRVATGITVVSNIRSRRHGGKGDHWETVRGNLQLADVSHELVDAQLGQFRQRPGAVDFLMKRAEPYLPYLLEEINRHGLPADLVLVPMVESAFEPAALSPKQAAGIWQFIPSTGQQYGLRVDDDYDGRYDVHAATQAACKYLKHLNRLFKGDWMLAFAAYNAGEGAVQRAIEANRQAGGGGGFWELDLPAETEAYVVKIISLAHAIADPSSLGLKNRKFQGKSGLARVEVGPDVALDKLIAAAGIAPELFYQLNPAYKPGTEPSDGTRNLLIPGDKAAILASGLSGAKVHAPRKVVVKPGETLTLLAKRHGVPVLKLAEWNNLTVKAPLRVGQELVVYPV